MPLYSDGRLSDANRTLTISQRPIPGPRTVLDLIRKLPLGVRDCVIQIAVSECTHAKRVDWSACNPELHHLGDFLFSERCEPQPRYLCQFLIRSTARSPQE